MGTVRFSKMAFEGDKLVEVSSRVINPSNCPHFIMVASHYREDGSCLCDDPKATVIRSWGYKWSRKQKRRM